jgi:hypothetical protein
MLWAGTPYCPNGPVILSLFLSGLSHGASKDSCFVYRLSESSALQCNLAEMYYNMASKTRRGEATWPEIPRQGSIDQLHVWLTA